jgi:serine/threonine protein kinase
MATSELASGQARAWSLLRKLGEGDAGEVFLVEALLDRQIAVLKRPLSTAFPTDMIRQASQIRQEAALLRALASLNTQTSGIRPPALLDQSKSGTEFNQDFFIVISKAPGLDLETLARLIHTNGGTPERIRSELQDPHRLEQIAVQRIGMTGRFPELLLLRIMSGLIDFLETIHSTDFNSMNEDYQGILWNDIKVNHIFWDPENSQITIIDWGNGQFLSADGVTKDRQYSRLDDYAQFLGEMGSFLENVDHSLYSRLVWPKDIPIESAYTAGILPIKERLSTLLDEALATLRHARHREAELIRVTHPSLDTYAQLERIQERILDSGEFPDYQATKKLLLALSRRSIVDKNLQEFRTICEYVRKNAPLDHSKLAFLSEIATIEAPDEMILAAIASGLEDDWPGVLWTLRSIANTIPMPSWWEATKDRVREFGDINPLLPTPYVALNRLIHALQAVLQKMPAHVENIPSSIQQNVNDHGASSHIQLMRVLKEEILPRWVQLEPDPPDSGIEYIEIERLKDEMEDLMPQAYLVLSRSLEQAKAHAQIAMDAWNIKDFKTASRALRNMILWDPDRIRVFTADEAIQSAPVWLQEIRNGPQKDEPLVEFVTRLGLIGRSLRNRIGPAAWLDGLLQALADLRKGSEPTKVVLEHPELREELGWLLELEPRRPILASKPVNLAREPMRQAFDPTISGVKEARLGAGQDVIIEEPLDTWTPEARGSSARVFLGQLRSSTGQIRRVAVKMMRPDQIEYALPLFKEEIQVLALLKDVPGVNPFYECGLIHLSSSSHLPPDNRNATMGELNGEVIRFGLDSVHNLFTDLENKVDHGWLPYLAIETRDRSDNLLLRCDAGYNRGRFLPILEGLCMAIQICDIIDAAHSRNIVYRDHKILHYYWQEIYNGIFVIDWNIAKRHPQGLPKPEAQFDLVQFGARALHHILTGRPAPGALPLGPTRPEEIEKAAHSYRVQWTYDDQRLPRELKDILEKTLVGDYMEVKSLREDLHTSFLQLSELARSDIETPTNLLN